MVNKSSYVTKPESLQVKTDLFLLSFLTFEINTDKFQDLLK